MYIYELDFNKSEYKHSVVFYCLKGQCREIFDPYLLLKTLENSFTKTFFFV